MKLNGNKEKEIVVENGKPVIYSIEEVTNFFEQVGMNTGYIIDPEEALAENFVFAINSKQGLPNPTITKRIQKIIKN